MRRFFFSALIVTLAVAGCIKPRPKTAPETSLPLDVPSPPPHAIALPEPEQPPEETTPATSDDSTAKEKPKKPSRPQGTRPQPEAAKPVEPKPDALPPPAEVVKPPAPAATQPTKALQPALQASEEQLTKQVEGQLAQARRDLDKVYYQGLSPEARTQYDAAKQFIAQASAALKEGNLVFAQKLAEKAVGLATNLVPR